MLLKKAPRHGILSIA